MSAEVWTSEPPSEAGWYWVWGDPATISCAAYFFVGRKGEWLASWSSRIEEWSDARRGDDHATRSVAPIESAEDLARLRFEASRVAALEARLAQVERELHYIEGLEARADSSVGMVDDPHVKALRAACKCARALLAVAREKETPNV